MEQSDDLKVSAPEEISIRLQKCGVAGAGGAGFPAYAKWRDLDNIDNLLINLQEGEPVFYGDRWLVTNNLELYREGLEYLLGEIFSCAIIATKSKYREKWFKELEKEFDLEIVTEDKLPIDPEKNRGLHLAYTKERYELSQEPALLWTVAGLQLNQRLLPVRPAPFVDAQALAFAPDIHSVDLINFHIENLFHSFLYLHLVGPVVDLERVAV